MNRDVVLGQYIPGNSLIHRLDPRVKIGMTVLFIIVVFMINNFTALLLTLLLVTGVLLCSGISIKLYLKSLKTILFVVLLTSILNLFYGAGPILWEWQFMQVRLGGVINSVFIVVRIVSLILFSSVLTFTTSPTDLTDALERLMKPLKVIRVPVHEISMMMSIALRFVPTLLEETDKIMSAQKARGADMESGGIFQRIRSMIPILIPLFVSSFRRAYELAMAMECRCYHGGEGRTKMKILHMQKLDYITIFTALAFCAIILLSSFTLPSSMIRGHLCLRNLLLKLAYDGTGYHGWQIQKNALSVQEVFQNALYKVLQEKPDLKACSRTDTGVHAREFCLSLLTKHEIPEGRLIHALNHYLPEDMAVTNCEEVPLDFHARYSCVGKEYVYQIWNNPVREPFLRNYTFHYWHKMDIEKCNQAAASFLGAHDFTSFCTLDNRKLGNLTRTVTTSKLEKNGSMICFRVAADGFLYNMVRIMVGTLLQVAQGKIRAEDILMIIEKKDRAFAGPTAPACGLFLNHVFYEDK